MTNKWHINKKGTPALCRAKKGNCPLGQHYDSETNASNAVESQMKEQYGLLPQNKMSVERKKDLAELIKRISGTRAPGFDYEIYASLSIAEEMGLNKVSITDKNGLTVNIATDNDNKQVDASLYVDRSVKAIKNYYEGMGVPIKDESTLARVVYHSDDINKGTLVQSGGPNVLDAAIIKADEIVDIVEIKNISGGAQLPVTTLKIDQYGHISDKSLNLQKNYMKEAIKHVKIQDADGTDHKVDFGDPEKNKRFPLHHFVEQYKDKGATSFIYTTNNGEEINRVDLTRNTDEVVDDLIDRNIEANVTLRANLSSKKANQKDIKRFNNILSKDYFKSGRTSNTESFTLKSIKEDKISKAGKFVRVGGYILPIKYDNYKENLNKRINKSDMKAFRLVLTGNIKTHY
ncbi:MAG TPA: hypothetical protein GXZ90_04395 [Clostridiales bacterium]|nr:hypothetical protein [Clostridiales bacterium]